MIQKYLKTVEEEGAQKAFLEDKTGRFPNEIRQLGYTSVSDLSRLIVGKLSNPHVATHLVNEIEILESSIAKIAGDLEFVILYFLQKNKEIQKNMVRYRFLDFKSTPEQDRDRELDFLTNITFGIDKLYRTLRIGMQVTLIEYDPESNHKQPGKIVLKRESVRGRSQNLPISGDEMNNRDVPSSYRPDMYGFFHINGGLNQTLEKGINPFAQSFEKWRTKGDVQTDPYEYLPKNIYEEIDLMAEMYRAISIRLIEILNADRLDKYKKPTVFMHKKAIITYQLASQDDGNGQLHFEVRNAQGTYIGSVTFFINNRIFVRMQENPRSSKRRARPCS